MNERNNNAKPLKTYQKKQTNGIVFKEDAYRDTSMEKAQRIKHKAEEEHSARIAEREKSNLIALREFDAEVEYIRQLQAKTNARQKVMAQLALELFSALTVQKAWRQHLARLELHVRKCARFLVNWTRYWVLYRKPRVTAVRIIQKSFRNWKTRSAFWAVLKLRANARRLQCWYRFWAARKRVSKRRALVTLRDKVIIKAMVFGTSRAATKLIKARIMRSEEQARRFKSASKIIRFFHSVLLQRNIQLLSAHSFANKLLCMHTSAILTAKSLFEAAGGVISVKMSTEGEHASKQPEQETYTTKQHATRRGGVAPLKKPTIIQGKLAKHQPQLLDPSARKATPTMTAATTLERARQLLFDNGSFLSSWRNHLNSHAEVILYLLSRIRPFDGSSRGSGGDAHEVSPVFAYLVTKRREYDRALSVEVAYANEQISFTRDSMLRNIYLREGALGRVCTAHLLPRESAPAAATSTNLSVHMTAGVKEEKVVIDLTAASALDTAPLPTKTQEPTAASKWLERNLEASAKPNRSHRSSVLGISNASELKHAGNILLPKEFRHAFFPHCISEIAQFVKALKEMVLSMPSADFERIVGKSGRQALELPEDGTNSQDCLLCGEAVRLGQPSPEALQRYVIFAHTTRLITASRARLRDLRQLRRMKLRAEDLVLGAYMIIDGRPWTQRAALIEEAEAAQESMSKFYSCPGEVRKRKLMEKELTLSERLVQMRAAYPLVAEVPSERKSGTNIEQTSTQNAQTSQDSAIVTSSIPASELLNPKPPTSASGQVKRLSFKAAMPKLNVAGSVKERRATAPLPPGKAFTPKPPIGKPAGKVRTQSMIANISDIVTSSVEPEPEHTKTHPNATSCAEHTLPPQQGEQKRVSSDTAVLTQKEQAIAEEKDVEAKEYRGEEEQRHSHHLLPKAHEKGRDTDIPEGKEKAAEEEKSVPKARIQRGTQKLTTKQQQQAKGRALQAVPVSKKNSAAALQQPDNSSEQYMSSFTRSVLLHWEMNANIASTTSAEPSNSVTASAIVPTLSTQIPAADKAHAPWGAPQRSLLSANQLRPVLPPEMFASGIIPVIPEFEIAPDVNPMVFRRRRKMNS